MEANNPFIISLIYNDLGIARIILMFPIKIPFQRLKMSMVNLDVLLSKSI